MNVKSFGTTSSSYIDRMSKGAAFGLVIGAGLGLVSAHLNQASTASTKCCEDIEKSGYKYLATDKQACEWACLMMTYKEHAPSDFESLLKSMDKLMDLYLSVSNPDTTFHGEWDYLSSLYRDQVMTHTVQFGQAVRERVNDAAAAALRFQQFCNVLKMVGQWAVDIRDNINNEFRLRLKLSA